MSTGSRIYFRAAVFSVALPAVALGAGFAIGTIVARCTEKIEDQQQLERVVEEERQKIGLPPHYEIKSKLRTATRYPGFTERRGESYTIYVNEQEGNSRGTVRHELCHILYRDVKERENNVIDTLRYWLLEEPRAVLCSIFK